MLVLVNSVVFDTSENNCRDMNIWYVPVAIRLTSYMNEKATKNEGLRWAVSNNTIQTRQHNTFLLSWLAPDNA